MIDRLIMLKVPSFDKVFEWRWLQEKRLKENLKTQQPVSGLMNKAQINNFILHYERITKYMLQEMPSRADVIFTIDNDHRISDVHLNKLS